MTFRQVQIAIEKILVRQHQEFTLQATLVGREVEPLATDTEISPLDLTPDENTALSNAMDDALSKLEKK